MGRCSQAGPCSVLETPPDLAFGQDGTGFMINRPNGRDYLEAMEREPALAMRCLVLAAAGNRPDQQSNANQHSSLRSR